MHTSNRQLHLDSESRKRTPHRSERSSQLSKFAFTIVRMAIVVIVLLSVTSVTHASIHCIKSPGSGSQSGADWNNAMPELPASLVRGDTYYVAAGSYGTHTFGDAENGATLITVKNATPGDHGTATGWSDAFAGTALFPDAQWKFTKGYYTVEGQTGSGLKNSYGFVLRSAIDWGFGFITFGDGNSSMTINNVTLSHVEVDGVCSNCIPDTQPGTGGMYNLSGAGTNNLTFQYGSIHDISDICALFAGNGITNFTYTHSWCATNRSTVTQHGEGFSLRNGTNVTFSYDVFYNIEGTGNIAELNGTLTNLFVYGCVFFKDNATGIGGAGMVGDNTPAGVIKNLKFYNNTIYGFNAGANSGLLTSVNGTSGYDIQNNLWYSNADFAILPSNPAAGISHDYNTLLNTPLASSDILGAHESHIGSGASNPFVSSASGNFHLVADTEAGNPLPAPFNQDPDGNPRGNGGVWDRGAYQFATGGGSKPAAPTALAAIVQ